MSRGVSTFGQFCRPLLLTALLSVVPACSLIRSEKGGTPEQPPLAQSPGENDSDSDLPFSMKVMKEVNDGKELHILGSVVARTAWSADAVLIRLTSLRSGDIVGVTNFPLTKLISETRPLEPSAGASVKAGEELTFSLSVGSDGLTDYQLELLWGAEAKQVVEKKKRSESLRLTVRNIEVQTLRGDCFYPPCEVRFQLKARLHNDGAGLIEKVVLGVGFVFTDSAPGTVPAQEEKIEVPNLKLFPGTSQPFKILLKEELTEEEAEELMPILRVISFDGEGS